MAIEVAMPQMGADMTEGTLVRWVKQLGEEVRRGDVLAEIETDKATVELEAFESGTLLKQAVGEGEVVPVGQVIALLGAPDEQVGDVERLPPASTPARRVVEHEASTPTTPAAAEPQPEPATALRSAETGPEPTPPTPRTTAPETVGAGASARQGHEGNGRMRISPVARRIAVESGLDVRGLHGSGPDGRILRRDVEAALHPAGETGAAESAKPASSPPEPPPERREPGGAAPVGGLSRLRQAIARRMTQSKQTQPHYYLTLDVDMTDAMQFREQLNASASEARRVSVNDLLVKACALALERHPKFNAEFAESGLKMHERINIDIGIALDEGLIAPAILDCGSKSLGRIAQETKDLVARAKGGGLTAAEYGEGTFTITNLGAYGVETLIGIINPPQAAILGVGSVMDQAVVRDGQVVVRKMMKIALSADHRVTDGAEGARFIKEIQGLLEKPVALAL